MPPALAARPGLPRHDCGRLHHAGEAVHQRGQVLRLLFGPLILSGLTSGPAMCTVLQPLINPGTPHRDRAITKLDDKKFVSQNHCRPWPELDIDLIPAHLSPGNSEAGARPVGERLRADEDCAVGS